ncbi:MAG: hypothetical protein FRX49_12649 [Trebouxia sp. A1-2]|nr:MAG: hypothetical protein FRX49_12649 [Trebouxia sp. A1-2]
MTKVQEHVMALQGCCQRPWSHWLSSSALAKATSVQLSLDAKHMLTWLSTGRAQRNRASASNLACNWLTKAGSCGWPEGAAEVGVVRALLTVLPFAFGLATSVAGAMALTVTLLLPLLATGATLVVSLKAVEASLLWALACSKEWWRRVTGGDDELGRLSLQFLLPFFLLGQGEPEEMSDIAAWSPGRRPGHEVIYDWAGEGLQMAWFGVKRMTAGLRAEPAHNNFYARKASSLSGQVSHRRACIAHGHWPGYVHSHDRRSQLTALLQLAEVRGSRKPMGCQACCTAQLKRADDAHRSSAAFSGSGSDQARQSWVAQPVSGIALGWVLCWEQLGLQADNNRGQGELRSTDRPSRPREASSI